MPIARWKDLCLDVTAPLDASPEPAFWAAALGLRFVDGDRLVGDDPSQTVWLNEVPERKSVKNRVHLDVHAASVEQIEALGARPLSSPGQFRWTVMADPDGGEFCVFERAEPPAYRFYELVVDAVDHAAQTAWWQTVLGGAAGDDHRDFTWLEQVPGLPFEGIVFVPVPEPKTAKNRVHWDVTVDGSAGIDALMAHGATVLRAADDEIRWHVLADPEGNEFCAFVAD